SIWGSNNEVAFSICCAAGIIINWPYAVVYSHLIQFYPPFVEKHVKEQTEQIIWKRKFDARLAEPTQEQLEHMVGDIEYFRRIYGKYYDKQPENNPLVEPNDPMYYKKNKHVMSVAKSQWRKQQEQLVELQREEIEASVRKGIDDQRWLKKRKQRQEPAISSYVNLPFEDMVRQRVQSISPTDRQLAYFAKDVYVPDITGEMTRFTEDEWLYLFSKYPEKKDDALVLWRDECARRIIASGKWPDGFHE
ncbi:MAG: hypothetical protein IKN04_14745, partial [Clostridia bacterium]|nr:hypothetical protein [Clostridia bacterium]